MTAVLKELLIATPSLLVASYGVMRLFVALVGPEKEWRSDKYIRVAIWCFALSLLSLITLFATVHLVEYLTCWFFFDYTFAFLFIGVFFLFISGPREERTEVPEERDGVLIPLIIFEIIVIPLATLAICDGNSYNTLRARLGWMPVGLALSSFLVNVTVARSNRKHHYDASCPLSRFALIYAGIVAFCYPICHSFAVAMDDKGYIEDDMLWFWSIFSIVLVGAVSIIVLRAFHQLMDGEPWRKVADELPSLDTGMSDFPTADDSYDSSFDYKPMDLYRSSYEDPDSAREDVFRQYDESRRISEDIQQFDRSHPDADLTDHYAWEDILDAESDGYLEED